MATTHVEVVSPTRVLHSGDAEMVVTRTVDGDIAFLADHVPLLGALDTCVTRIVAEDGSEVRIAVAGGFVEVRDNHVIVLAADAALGSEIDVDAARAELREAEARQRDDATDEAAEAALRRAQVRLEAAGVAAGATGVAAGAPARAAAGPAGAAASPPAAPAGGGGH
ncbi:MAG: ATP synthase F1 subunit epsilon [Acidimicrobiales bacterium]